MPNGHAHRHVPFRCIGIAMAVAIGLLFVSVLAARSAEHRILPAGQLPADVRLEPLKDLDGYFPFTVPPTREAWEHRAVPLRMQLIVSQGLWPMPTKMPLNPVIHGRLDRDDYSVEKVYFESMPGFFVTGNLFRPKGTGEKHAGVLCPHGHWANGRFYDCGRDSVRLQITQGAERFEDGGRNPIQSRCVQLARMGCVVFHWDMIGYADSQQISAKIIHGFDKQRPEMDQPERWGLFSPQAESRLQSAMGLQTFSSLRALDFLSGLPDVDANRIAVTGASGGGTQTFMLSAIDPRVDVAFPAVMVSTAMQGGCTCENACCLRIGTGNVEIAGLCAPKPLGMTAANDWTVEMAAKGLPQLKQLYTMYGAADQVMLKPLLHFGHNYNYVSRAAMYCWMNKHLKLGLEEPIVEEAYERLSTEELTVWDDQHLPPEGGPEFERRLLRWWAEDAESQLHAALPVDETSLDSYQRLVGAGLDAIVGRRLSDLEGLELLSTVRMERGKYVQVQGLLTRKLVPRELVGYPGNRFGQDAQEQVPFVMLRPTSWKGRTCVMVFPQGKAGLFGPAGGPTPQVSRLLAAGIGVCSADLLYQGEFLKDGQPLVRTRRVGNPREAAAYTFGYNASVFAQRVHDILSVVAFLKQGEFQSHELDLVGAPGAGHWAAAARGQARDAITRLAIDTAGFRFAQVRSIHDPDFLPGGAKYHDLPGMLAIAAPAPLWLAGESETAHSPITAAYQASGDAEALKICLDSTNHAMDNAIDWLLGE